MLISSLPCNSVVSLGFLGSVARADLLMQLQLFRESRLGVKNGSDSNPSSNYNSTFRGAPSIRTTRATYAERLCDLDRVAISASSASWHTWMSSLTGGKYVRRREREREREERERERRGWPVNELHIDEHPKLTSLAQAWLVDEPGRPTDLGLTTATT